MAVVFCQMTESAIAEISPKRHSEALRKNFGIADPVLRSYLGYTALPKPGPYGLGSSESGLLSNSIAGADVIGMINNQDKPDSVPISRPFLLCAGIHYNDMLGMSRFNISYGRGVSCLMNFGGVLKMKGYWHFGYSRAYFKNAGGQTAFNGAVFGFNGYSSLNGIKSSIMIYPSTLKEYKLKAYADITWYTCLGRSGLSMLAGLDMNIPKIGMAYMSSNFRMETFYRHGSGVGFTLISNICGE